MSATVDRGQVSRSLRRTLLGDAEARSIRAEVFRLALPSIGEQLLNMTVGMVDTYLMGHISAVALTGVGLSNNMVMLVQTFVMAVATGTTAVVDRLIVDREPETASRVVQQSLMLGATIGAVLTTLPSIRRPGAQFYRPEPDSWSSAARTCVSGHVVCDARYPGWALCHHAGQAIRAHRCSSCSA